MIRAMSTYSYIGIFFGVAVCIGFFFGRWLDRKWGTAPWLSMVGLGIGVASGFTELYRLSKRALREEEK
jgi:ATP synthase protein I